MFDSFNLLSTTYSRFNRNGTDSSQTEHLLVDIAGDFFEIARILIIYKPLKSANCTNATLRLVDRTLPILDVLQSLPNPASAFDTDPLKCLPPPLWNGAS